MIILNKWFNKKLNCSITVESSIVFIIVIMVLFMCLGPMFICKTSNDIIKNLDNYTKNLSYLIEIKEDDNAKDISKTANEKFKNLINIDDDNTEGIFNLTNSMLIASFLMKDNDNKNNPFSNIKLIFPNDINVYDEENKIIKYDYGIYFRQPLNILNINGINQRFILSRRAFVGSYGNRQFNADVSSDSDSYYVAKDYNITKIYHKYVDCSYLKKEVYTKAYDEVKNLYNKCKYCIKKDSDLYGMSLYVTSTGNNYHINKNCPTMTAYVSVVDKEFVDSNNLNLCSRCNKRIDDGGD